MTCLLKLGVTEQGAVQDIRGGLRAGSVRDPFSDVVGIIENSHFTLHFVKSA